MTVKELINLLKKMPQEYEIELYSPAEGEGWTRSLAANVYEDDGLVVIEGDLY